MNEDALNLSVRKFLKQFGVTAQREIEQAVHGAVAAGRLRGDETLAVRATLSFGDLISDHHIDGEIVLGDGPVANR